MGLDLNRFPGRFQRVEASWASSTSPNSPDKSELGNTIVGIMPEHRLYHFRLAFSGFAHAHAVAHRHDGIEPGHQGLADIRGGTLKPKCAPVDMHNTAHSKLLRVEKDGSCGSESPSGIFLS